MNCKLNNIIKMVALLESSNRIVGKVQIVYNHYKDYNYIDDDLDNYHIKTIDEFNNIHGGICWDFIGPIANDLNKLKIPYKCYFTGLYKNDEMVVSHTYIIAETSPKYWIECVWKSYNGLHKCTSYKDIEIVLMKNYEINKSRTLMYNSFEVYGYTVQQFFNYLENNRIEL